MDNDKQAPSMEVNAHYLSPCPASPNCVSSLAAGSSRHYIAPLSFDDDPRQQWNLLKSVLANEPGISRPQEQGCYMHVSCRSRIFGFIDDLEFYRDDQQCLCHVRSASRLGYYDFGVNRRRVERIRARLKAFSRQDADPSP